MADNPTDECAYLLFSMSEIKPTLISRCNNKMAIMDLDYLVKEMSIA